MKYLIICSLILLALACNSLAREPLDLGHDAGRLVLESITNNTTNLSANETSSLPIPVLNASQSAKSDLWSWGTIPVGYAMNESGKPVRLPTTEEWHPSI